MCCDVAVVHQPPHLVRAGATCVVLVVQLAGDLQDAALGGGYPQVAAAGVEDDTKGLRGCPQRDLAVILCGYSKCATLMPTTFVP